MTHAYAITGMTCTGCQAEVQSLLSDVAGVKNVSIDLPKGVATIDMAKHVPTTELKAALKDHSKYNLEEKDVRHQMQPTVKGEKDSSWIVTYKPLLIIGAYITGITILAEYANGKFYWESWMQNFMAAFFLLFSFFKLLDIRGFADSYSTYDIIAKKWKSWGYVYAFIELGLGITFLLKFYPLITNAVTFVIISISIIGVLQSVLNRRKIKCACLGTVLSLPMSTITIYEDALMIGMSAVMIITLLQ